ncbi:SusC/RagA family TonB-linked outer membrane protein [Capnocytophaga canimorsus]|uniref:SusC/RagA family TonB-linked outer membrane protein n=1 Tax=Capnocytophaga canimorsus TaxID=28188 RepID=UPI0013A52DE4|nr:SusC/RagA family TonB-linked outer membrane protein [Capnocytophaga canimorsus]
MRLKLTWMVMLFFTALQLSFAQEKTVKGTVKDASGVELPGVAVQIKGEQRGTETDFDGNYSLQVAPGKILVFSYLGMKNVEKTVGNSNTINVVMEEDTHQLGEVVVTGAMGISRSEKSLGYAVSKIGGEDIVKTKDPNLVNSLAGKAAGINITQQSGSVGGSSKIVIRGASSLSGDNQPLFVVDGMPINNTYLSNGIQGAVDYGNAAADINSLDVESMDILKGAAATALYGARAKNGAIIITTKRGKQGKMNLVYNTSIRMDRVAKLPDYQNEYSQGLDGRYSVTSFNGWGEKINGQTVKNFLGQDVTLQAYPDNVKNFFNTGTTQIHSFDLNGGDEKSDYRFGYTLTLQNGVMPFSSYKKNDLTFNVGRKLNQWLDSRITGTYTRGLRNGLSAQGSNDPNVIIGSILGMPRTTDIDFLRKNVYNEQGKPNSWDGAGKTNIPYYVLENNKIGSDNERFLGSVSFQAKPLSWLTIKNQSGIDTSIEERNTLWSVGTIGEIKGKFSDKVYRTRILNNDFIAMGNFKLGNKFGLNTILGYNVFQREYSRKENTASELIVPDLLTYANAKANVPTNYYSIKRIHGVYGEISADYDDTFFLTLTGRNDWSSTLPVEHNSYFYPSVSFSYVFTKNLHLNWLNFGKVRLNWANVGSDEDPYLLEYEYAAQSTWFSQYGAGGEFPHKGVSAFSIPRTLPNKNLKPQNQVSYEAGLDLRLFNNRVNIDATVYRIDTDDQIISIDVPLSTGFFAKKINAGKVRNEGFEIQLGIIPIKTQDFEWNTTFNFSQNKNTIIELDGNLKEYSVTSGWSGLQIKAAPGEPLSIFGTAWKRNDNGEIIINEKTGLREVETGKNLGNIDPDFRLGINNSFRIKDFTLSAVIDWKQGGKMFSGTAASLRSTGLVQETLAHRGETFVDTGVNTVAGGGYKPNATPVKNMQTYWGHISSTSNTEGNVYDASYMKLREVSLVWNMPKKYLPENSFIKGVMVGIEGRNLWNIIDNVPHVDPELNFFGPGTTGGGVEFNSIPLTRTFGVSCKVNF